MIEAAAHLQALVRLVASLFSEKEREHPACVALEEMLHDIEELEASIANESLDGALSADTPELSSFEEHVQALLASLPAYPRTVNQRSLRLLVEEVHKQTYELLDIAMGSACFIEVEEKFEAIRRVPKRRTAHQ